MLERDIAERFKTIFRQYPLLAPSMHAEAGWPDRIIQLPNSRIIPVELKAIQVNKHKYFVLSTFRQTQAAWMAKWQRNGGIGFVFVGLSIDDSFVGYHIITCARWNDWLSVSSNRYYLEQIAVLPTNDSVNLWFDTFIYRSQRKVA